MFEAFQQRLLANPDFFGRKKLLLAVSGGVDSIVMTDLFNRIGHDISIAHCNFNLRGTESDADEDLVRTYADKNNIPFFTTRFDTDKFASDNKLSIQVAARRLRYAWFNELVEQNGFDFVLTAHHADDNLETFLINLSRGTGLDGLTGIPFQNGKI
ncbi:MAG: tRNA lysidine(34) synthetase TilS, partial [Flavobacterium sp.]